MARFWYQNEAAYRTPKRLAAPLGTWTRVVRSSKAGIWLSDARTSRLYSESVVASSSPWEGFWEAEISVKEGGPVASVTPRAERYVKWGLG